MKTKALFTGSFDPLTSGHLNIIERAAGVFDELTVGIIINPQKRCLFTLEEREEMIKEVVAPLGNVSVTHFSGLLADFVNENGYNIILRGLRDSKDFEYEMEMAQMNARLFNEGVETVFFMTKPEYAYISSTTMKEVCSLGGSIDGLVPESILEKMKAAYNK